MSKSMSRFAIPAHTMLILGSCRFSGSPDQDRFGMRPELYAWGAEFWSGLTHRTRSWFLSVSVRHIKVLADGDERLFRLGILEAKMCPLIGGSIDQSILAARAMRDASSRKRSNCVPWARTITQSGI